MPQKEIELLVAHSFFFPFFIYLYITGVPDKYCVVVGEIAENYSKVLIIINVAYTYSIFFPCLYTKLIKQNTYQSFHRQVSCLIIISVYIQLFIYKHSTEKCFRLLFYNYIYRNSDLELKIKKTNCLSYRETIFL